MNHVLYCACIHFIHSQPLALPSNLHPKLPTPNANSSISRPRTLHQKSLNPPTSPQLLLQTCQALTLLPNDFPRQNFHFPTQQTSEFGTDDFRSLFLQLGTLPIVTLALALPIIRRLSRRTSRTMSSICIRRPASRASRTYSINTRRIRRRRHRAQRLRTAQ